MKAGQGGEDAINRASQECEQEEAQRLGAFRPDESPTMQVERNYRTVRWGDIIPECLAKTGILRTDIDEEIARSEAELGWDDQGTYLTDD